MPTYSPSAQAALLRASNRVFEPKTTADSLAELADGIVLGHILHELDPEFNPSELDQSPSTTRYLTNKRNIQMVYKGLFRFIRRQVPELGCQAKKFDYHGIAENPEPQGISQLLAVMLSAAAMGPDNQRFVPRIQNGLDKQTQAEIMQIIRTMQLDINNSRGDDDLDEAIDAVMEARDIDLLVEEQNAALRQQLDLTKKNLSDYITRLEYLQQSHEELKYEKEKNDRELEVLRKATQDGANSAESIKVLEAQVHEQMEIIARNEELIRKYERNLAHLESEVQRLTQKSIEADELRDQVMEWKHKSEELEKKANTAERYKQKLESQQHLVREVQNLQYEKAELQDQLRSLTSDHERSDRTRKAEDELTKMITQSEQHLWDERHQKTQLMKDMTALEEEVVRLRARQSHDENFIKDLQEQLQNNSGPQGGIPGDSGAAFNLEDELNSAAEDGQVNLPLELSRLKAENALLRSTVGSTGDTMTLRKELDEEKRQRAHLQQSFNDVFEKHAVAQDQIEALIKNMTNEGTQAFVNLRTQCMQSNFELEQCRKQVKDLEAQVADQGRELLDARTQLSALGKDSIEALNELKNTDRLIRESLKAELDRVRQELGYSGAERDARETQLVEALLEKDKLRKAVEESKELQDATPSDADNSEAGKKNAEKVEKLRARLIEIRKQLETSEQDKIDLQRKLKAAHDGEAAAAQKAASDQIIRNLERENGLIATAWYDLTSRLQSNHVVLQRRHDAPRSWLNKQRQMVNATPRR
ncbi:hypothetical protein BGZ61DRAFT_452611 [Ilyonectria robusta]|uniref:uncharacterized protein n=1 Tax=Ilyonectria robusta TaxID=1079257 RepID=UPI001E8DC1E5|nr:uncharacterized protein BGZ61DRAFT_452611 [Ilyonectria robusta]KAH8694827.1 hypothetical protein BGZ61DRAFT_452611 [Ilyonectria robusta]